MKKLIKYITQEEFEKIFQATLKSKHKNKKKLAAAMLLGFEAGMRISEIVGGDNVPALIKSNVSLERNTIRIEQGKGMKDRIVPLPKRFTKRACDMLPLKLNRRTLQRWITSIAAKQLDKPVNFHMLRHGFGSHLAQSGRPLHEIQMLMGHSSLSVTEVYLHANPKHAVEGAREVF